MQLSNYSLAHIVIADSHMHKQKTIKIKKVALIESDTSHIQVIMRHLQDVCRLSLSHTAVSSKISHIYAN